MNIFITGTSSGIGLGLAKKYLENGDQVFGLSRKNNDELDQYESFHFLSQDLAKFDELEQSIPEFTNKSEPLDLIILNAGILPPIQDLNETSMEEIQKVMDVNVWANKKLIDLLFARHDHIDQLVAISSGAAVSGARGWNAYALSKATLNMLIQLYAKEFPHCHFCSMAPGIIDTNMQEYIYGLPSDKRFPVLDKLKSAKGTSKMPPPDESADLLIKGFQAARNFESGSFLDIRNMDIS